FQLRAVSAAGGGMSASPEAERAAALATNLGDFKPLGGNDVQLLTDYDVSIELLIADIEAAKYHVHLLYYIFENDKTGNRVGGPVVAHLQAIFFVDRAIETDQMLDEPELFPDFAEPAGPAVAQLLPSGPGYGRENAQALMVDLLHSARKRVVITTPYFVPDE